MGCQNKEQPPQSKTNKKPPIECVSGLVGRWTETATTVIQRAQCHGCARPLQELAVTDGLWRQDNETFLKAGGQKRFTFRYNQFLMSLWFKTIIKFFFSNSSFYFLKCYLFIWLYWVFTALCGLSLGVASRSSSLLGVLGLLIAGASLIAEDGLWSTDSVVGARGLSCSEACGIFPDQGSNPCPLHWQVDS